MKGKTMKKKIVTLLATTSMIVSVMTGCSFEKQPTAEELIAGGFSSDMQAMKADMVLEFAATAPMDEMGTDTKMTLEMNMEAEMETDSNTSLMSGNAEIGILGMQIEQEMKQYTQTDGNEKTVYNYSSEDNMWTYGTEDIDGSESSMKKLNPEMFSEITLEKSKKEDTEYFVDAKISAKDMAALSNMDVSEMLSITGESLDYDELVFDVSFVFDKETKHLTSYKLELDEYEKDGVSIDSFVLIIQNIKFSNDNVEIPADVIREAVNYDEAYNADVLEDEPEDGNAYVGGEFSYSGSVDMSNAEVHSYGESGTSSSAAFETEIEDVDSMHAGSEEIPENQTIMEGMAETEYMTMAEQFFGRESVLNSEILEYSGVNISDDAVCNYITTFLVAYSQSEYLDYMQYWNYLSDTEKTASAYMVKLEFVEMEDMVDSGVDEKEMNALLDII